MPEDPVNCVNYGMTTPICNAFIQAFPISMRKAMEFDDTTPISMESIIHYPIVRHWIELKNGKTMVADNMYIALSRIRWNHPVSVTSCFYMWHMKE